MTPLNAGANDGADPVVLITGASAGIGAACAGVFHAEGYRVAGCSNDPAPGIALEGQLNSRRLGSALFVECDVRAPAEITATVAAAVDAFGRIDVLINNVGVNRFNAAADEY